jgi:hypothetical protein
MMKTILTLKSQTKSIQKFRRFTGLEGKKEAILVLSRTEKQLKQQ